MNATAPAYSKPTIALALLCGALPGLFLLITSTTYLVPGEFVYDIKRLLQLCIMTVLFLAATLNPSLRNAFGLQLARIPKWVKTLLLLIVALGITSSIANATSNMHLAYSLLEVALLSLLVLAALVIAACRVVAGELFDQVAITLLALTSIAVGIQELLGVAAALANDTEFYSRISLMYYSWPRFYNQVQAWTLPVLATLPIIWAHSKSELLSSKTFQALVCLAALLLNWYIIIMTGGRGVALSLLAGFSFCLLIFPVLRGASFRWHFFGLVLGVALYTLVGALQNQPTASELTDKNSSSNGTQLANPDDWFEAEDGKSRFSRQSIAGRLSLDSSGRGYMWKAAWRQVQSNPLLGIGPMQYACIGEERLAAHPHNFLFQFAAEWGLISTVLLTFLVAYLILTVYRARTLLTIKGGQEAVASLLLAGVFSAATYSLLSGVLIMPASQTAALLVGGWALGALRYNPMPSAQSPDLSRFVLPIVSAVSLAVLTVSANEFRNLSSISPTIPSGDSKFPRYWQEGKACKYFSHHLEPTTNSQKS